MVDEGAPQRHASISSVASKSSCASGVSLTRQSRTRKRSRTVTGASSRFETVPKSQAPESFIPYSGDNLIREPLPPLPLTRRDVWGAPPRPQRSPLRDTGEVTTKAVPVGDEASKALQQDEKSSLTVEESQSHHGGAKLTRQTSGMQIRPTASQPEPPLSAFSRNPEITGVDPVAVNLRDSVSTHPSRQSSSAYPPSNSTTSDLDSPPSPQSVIHVNDRYDASYEPVVNETQMYDGDDVSYRLQLLVNNNYFLPPAHSKPSAADFAAMEKTVQKKPSTPTFFERLRGRSKSKPTTPTGPSPGFDPAGPALRTAADSITSSHLLRPQLPQGSSQFQRSPPPEARTGRVVVVREKMEDVAVAAKKAEQEMKARALRRDQGSQNGRITVTDVIDPTDAVDLPPPSSNYPFAVQASALRGLGVQDSLGAALLADRLPPPQSPGMSSSDPDDHWRRALLHDAVHHSLDNTPDTSFSMMMQATSTPLASPLVEPSRAPRAPETPSMPLLDQRIISNPRLSDNLPPTIPRKKSSLVSTSSKSRSKRPGSSKLSSDGSSGVLPLRSATPSEPLTPLTPAPRKHVINLTHSTSRSELDHHTQFTRSLSRTRLRRAVSSPGLSDKYGSDARSLAETLPPLPTPTQSFASFSDQENLSRMPSQAFTIERDHESVDGEGTLRRSFAMSDIEGRPSSEYSQPSPTMSAFRDAPSDMNGVAVNQVQWRGSVDASISTSESPALRYSAMSPPPRISSSVAFFALSPPPRSTSLNYRIRSTPSPQLSEGGRTPEQPSTSLTDDTPLITAPGPATSYPLSQRRGGVPLSLEIPPTDIAVAIHSAPGPSSPTSFFDVIQAQPSAIDDLESSDESDEEEVDVTQSSAINSKRSDPYIHPTSATPPTSRPGLMRLGNHSTPYISHVKGEIPRPSTGIKDKKPIGNIPVRNPFFRERAGKSDSGHGPPVSSLDFFKYAQQKNTTIEGHSSADITSERRPSVGNVPTWKTLNPKAQESLKKLDGMLIQHMATERDTIKRIAASARSNSSIPVERGS
ncbi:hypothetical protein C0995_010094 [Termitomyces sp. Mi166|nr:hypothetical protein C0995_010094 [Termitomyces sp. Mi166\